MSRSTNAAAIAMLALASVLPATAHATEPDFQGKWTVTSSEPAPWADPHEKPLASDLKALIGHGVVFQRDRIDGPAPLGCRKPHYRIKQYAPDMLFQAASTSRSQRPPPSASRTRRSGRWKPAARARSTIISWMLMTRCLR